MKIRTTSHTALRTRANAYETARQLSPRRARTASLNASIGLLLGLLACQLGCGQIVIPTSFGSTSYPDKNTSINGLGVFEKLCNKAGMRMATVTRLSPRLEKSDCILMIGDTFKPPAKEARDWLEEWLARKPGRTVIYVGRDFDAQIYYRQKTLAAVPAERQARAVLDLAEIRSTHDAQLFEEIDKDVFCRWFVLRVSQPQREITDFSGPWSDALHGSEGSWPVRTVLATPLPELSEDKPTWTPAPTMTARPRFGAPPTRQKDEDLPLVYTSYWSDTDINDDETWEIEWDKAPEATTLLAGDDGTPLVTKLTSDRYPQGQILTLVNAAPLLNGSLVEPHFRQVAHQLIEQLQNTKKIAVLPLDSYGIQVSHVPVEENEVAGLSVLTTWPMNMIIAHLALLGVLFCLALYPILGRPQPLAQASVTDFGQHAEALGQMLYRTRDRHFALQIISDYFRLVRGESMPTWLRSDQPVQVTDARTTAPQCIAPSTTLPPDSSSTLSGPASSPGAEALHTKTKPD